MLLINGLHSLLLASEPRLCLLFVCFLISAQVPESKIKGGLRADEWVNATLKEYGGRGGGRPHSAQGKSPDASGSILDRAIHTATKVVEAWKEESSTHSSPSPP